MGSLNGLTWGSLTDDLWLRAKRERIPLTGFFELTPLCNFRCRMCYVRLDHSEVLQFGRIHSGDEWVSVAEQAVQMGTYAITLTGGEPLTHPDFEQIYTELSRRGIMVSLLSNGSLLSERHMKLFIDYPPSRIRFTLYGASNETYGRLCGCDDGFDRVMRAARLVKDAGLPLSFSYTETTENLSDYDAVMDIARDFDVPIMVGSDINRSVRVAHDEADQLRVSLDKRRVPSGKDNNIRRTESDVLSRAVSEGLVTGAFSKCRIYRTAFFINWNGNMENCSPMSWCKCRPFEDGFAAAWEELQNKLSMIKLPRKCVGCPDVQFCAACPGLRNAETGTPEGISERHCSEAYIRHESRCQRLEQGGECS